jgi:hypothetical protein
LTRREVIVIYPTRKDAILISSNLRRGCCNPYTASPLKMSEKEKAQISKQNTTLID